MSTLTEQSLLTTAKPSNSVSSRYMRLRTHTNGKSLRIIFLPFCLLFHPGYLRFQTILIEQSIQPNWAITRKVCFFSRPLSFQAERFENLVVVICIFFFFVTRWYTSLSWKIVSELRVMEAWRVAKRFPVYNRDLLESLTLNRSRNERLWVDIYLGLKGK